MIYGKPHTRFQIFTTLVVPLAMGLGMYMLLGLIIDREVITNELLLRYLTGHPISRITTFMFFVGVAALLVIANNVFDQYCNCDKIGLAADGNENEQSNSDKQNLTLRAEELIGKLQCSRWSVRSHYLWQRLSAALGFVQRTGSLGGVEDEIKYLSDIDRERQQRRYSLVRIVIWATPMLGFLGTVLGISQALGGIQVGPDNDFQQMLNGLRGSLYVAFDTTALALTLSIFLMFFQFFVDRFETQLLEVVDSRTHEELSPLYQGSTSSDKDSPSFERIHRAVLASSQKLVSQQTEIWRNSMATAEAAWVDSISGVSETVRANLSASLQDAVSQLSESISSGIKNADESMAKRWEQWQVTLSENSRQLNAHQQNLTIQSEIARELLEKTAGSADAQAILNKNTEVLTAISNLQDAMEKLADSNGDKARGKGRSEQNHVSSQPKLKVVYGEEENQEETPFRFIAKKSVKRDAA